MLDTTAEYMTPAFCSREGYTEPATSTLSNKAEVVWLRLTCHDRYCLAWQIRHAMFSDQRLIRTSFLSRKERIEMKLRRYDG